jgi:hypothetical protein
LSRFEIVRRIGDGGMGIVYEATDREHGGKVALKTLHRFDAESLLYLKQEFRALQDIQHPNLVRLGELMRDGDTWFFTMELVAGKDLFEHLGARSPRRRDRSEDLTVPRTPSTVGGGGATWPSGLGSSGVAPSSSGERPVPSYAGVDEDRLREAFAQLAEALGALHAAGKVHRDVKPSNVLVTPEGRVVLVDFGLILDASAPQKDRAVVGTAKYMAPEQATGQEVGPKADLYSLGVVLYQCIAGRSPFEGDAARVIERKLMEDPPRASLVAPHVPRDLDDLCARLLDRDPSRRPDAAEVAERLRRARGSKGRERERRAPFVGREPEMLALRAALDRVRRGETVSVLVTGESGMGKSALARRFLRDDAAGADALVLAGRCYEREVVPYKALDGVMDALCQHLAPLDDADVMELFPAHAALLTQAFPVMRRLARFEVAARQRRSRTDLLAVESRGRFFETIRELFTKLGARRTLVLFVDDLHWADADSLALLAEILRPPSPPRMLFLATSRPGAPLPPATISVPVGPLGHGDIATLTRTLLGEGHARAAAAVAAESHGHPLFALELARYALETGEDAPARSTLDEALAARVGRLDDASRALLELLAVAGVALPRKNLARAAALDPDAFAHSSAVLRASHLARAAHARGDAHALEPYHDRVREAVIGRLDAAALCGRHLALATALEQDERRDPDAVATHFVEAGERARAAPFAREAAHKAFEALAYDRAAALYARAIELGECDAFEMSRLRQRLGEALASAGRGREAAEAFLRAAEGRSGEHAIELRRRSAEELLIAGDVDRGMAAMRDVLARIGLRMPRSTAVALVLLLVARAALWLRGSRTRLRREADLPAQALLRLDACWSVARAFSFIDPLLSFYFQTRMLLMALRLGEPFRLAYALGLEAGWTATRGTHTRARAEMLFARAGDVARESGRPEIDALLRGCVAFAALVQGRLPEAVAESDAALGMLSEQAPGHFWEQRSISSVGMWALSAEGDLATLAARARPALREAEDRGDVHTATILRTGNLAWLWLRDGDPAGARAAAETAASQWTRGGYHHQHWWATVALAQVDLYESKGHAAWARVSRDFARARRALLFSIELNHFDARHVHARTAIAAAREAAAPEERERLLREAEADVRWIARRGPPYGAPWVLHLGACIAAVRGDRDATTRGFAEAIPDFDATPVPIWAASARWQLARLLRGEEARALREAARGFWNANGVVDPDRMSAVFAPGVSAP